MPSTISDFSLQIQKISPNVQVARDEVVSSTAYNIIGGNLYRRTVTINNAGRAAQTNYLIAFQIDHNSWNNGQNPRTGFLLSSLRVYDANGTTRLNHWIEGDMTNTCIIFVRIPSIPNNASKNIFMEYGNPALEDLRDFAGTCGSVFSKLAPYGSTRRSLVANFMSNDAGRFHNGQYRDGFRPPIWMNRASNNQMENVLKRNAEATGNMNDVPVLNYNRQNGLPALNFDGVDDCYAGWLRSVWLLNDQEFTFFEVFRPNTVASAQSVVRFQSNNPYTYSQFNSANASITDAYMIPIWGSTGLFILSFDGGTSGLSSGVIANQWQLSCQTWRRNTTNGMQTYRNGSIVAQRNSSTNPIPNWAMGTESNAFTPILNIGSLNQQSEFFAGDIGQIMIFSEQLSASDRQQVETYLNTKWRLYNTAQMPTISVGGESTISQPHTFTSYAPIASYDYTSTIEDGIAKGKGQVKLLQVLATEFAPVITVQNWSGDGANVSTSSNTTVPYSRAIQATTSAKETNVLFSRIDGSNNYARLDAFNIANIVTGASTFASANDDFIQFELWCENANLSATSSWIQFEDSAGSNTRRAAFTASVNGALEAGLNIVRIRKSSFAAQSGTLSWSNAVRMRIRVVTTTGTCDVELSRFRLECDYERLTATQAGAIMNLATAVSSDNDATYYTNTQLYTRVKNRTVDEERISLTVEDILSKLDTIKFYDLPSMPAVSVILAQAVYAGSTNWNLQFYTYFVRHILLMLFPATILDIDLDLPASEFTAGVSTKQELDGWNCDATVGEALYRFLEPIAGVVYFNPLTGRVTARNAYNYAIDNAQLQSAFRPVIFDFKVETARNDESYNALEPQKNYWKYWNGQNFPTSGAAGFGFGDGDQFIKPTIAAGVRSETFHDLEKMTNIGVVYNDKKHVLYSELWWFGGWNATLTTDSSAFNNSNCAPISATLTKDLTVIISWRNTGANRYFTASGFGWNVLFCTEFFNSAIGKVATLENAPNIALNGRKEKGVNPNHSLVIMNASNNPQFTNIAQKVMDMSQTQQEYIIDCQFNPTLSAGKVVEFQDKKGRKIKGYVTELSEYSTGEQYTHQVRVKPIV